MPHRMKNEHHCHPFHVYTHRFSIARQSGGARTTPIQYIKDGLQARIHILSHASVSPWAHATYIPTECNKQHGISIRPSPSSSYSINPPNVISSMTYPSSCHRCILTVVRYCVGTVLDSICIHTVVRYMCCHRSRQQMHTRRC